MNTINWRPGMKFRRINKGSNNYGKTLTVDYVTNGGSMIWAKEDGCWSGPGGIELVNEVPVIEAPIPGPSKVTKHFIICVVDAANQPLPSTKPAVYSTLTQARAVAKSMAEKYPVSTFCIYEMVGEAHIETTPRTVINTL